MKQSRPMKTSEAIFLIVVGLLLGSIFTFGMNHWNAPVSREEATAVSAIYAQHRMVSEDGGSVSEILLRFEDHEQLSVDGCCVTKELRGRIDAMEPGARVSALVHPNAGTILELTVDGEVLLDFDTAVEELNGERIGFNYLGVFLYALAVFGFAGLIGNKIRE